MRLAGALLASALLAAVGVWRLEAGGRSYVVRAVFADAEGLQPNFAVREQGVVVGNVGSVSLTRRDRALVTLDLQPAAAPIGAGATATINPSNLLGEKYVAIDPGDTRRPQPSGSVIPLTRTSAAPELDQVLNAFDSDTRRATAVFLAEEGDALLGRGHDLAGVLATLPGSLTSGRQLVSGLDHDNAALGRLITQSDQVLSAAAPQRAALGRLVDSARGAFGTLAGRDRALAGTISNLPGTLAELRQTLVSLQNAAGPLGRAAAGLRATASPLTASLDAVPAFARAAAPTLHTAGGVAPILDRLARVAPPVLAALEPTAARLAGFARTAAPVSKLLNDDTGTLLDVIQGWARAIADRDGIGHLYRVEALLPNNTLDSILGAVGISASLRRELGLLRQAPAASRRARPRHAARPARRRPAATPAPPASSGRPARPSSPAHLLPVLPPLPGGSTAPTLTTPASRPPLPSLLRYLLGR